MHMHCTPIEPTSEHYVLDFYDDITGSEYKKFIDHAISRSDAFLLVFIHYSTSVDYSRKMRSMREELATHLLKTRTDHRWPGTILLDGDVEDENGKLNIRNDPDSGEGIDIYAISPSVTPFLYLPNRVFGWNKYNYPQDLCFFKDGACWFMNTCHERIASIWDPDEEVIQLLRDNGVRYELRKDERGPYRESYPAPTTPGS